MATPEKRINDAGELFYPSRDTVPDLNPTYNANETEIACGGLKLFFPIPGVKIKLYTGLSDKA